MPTTHRDTLSHAEEAAVIDRAMAHRVMRGGHWLYDGAHDKDGYAYVRVGSRTDGSRRMVYLHNVAGDYYKGAKPGGQWDHTCHEVGCWNPAHLVSKSQQANLDNRRGYRTSRQVALDRVAGNADEHDYRE